MQEIFMSNNMKNNSINLKICMQINFLKNENNALLNSINVSTIKLWGYEIMSIVIIIKLMKEKIKVETCYILFAENNYSPK